MGVVLTAGVYDVLALVACWVQWYPRYGRANQIMSLNDETQLLPRMETHAGRIERYFSGNDLARAEKLFFIMSMEWLRRR